MKIFCTRDLNSQRGNANFLRSLLGVLESDFNCKVTTSPNFADICLANIWMRPLRIPTVLRIDGVYYDLPRIGMNKGIRESLALASGVVYQSAWGKKFVESRLRVHPKQSVVIHNGADTSSFRGLSIDKKGFDRIVLCCAQWMDRKHERKAKRLDAIVDAFLIAAGNNPSLNLGLFIAGKNTLKLKHPRVVNLGHVDHGVLPRVYASSDVMVHICHLDACPNSVVDALVCGLPVVCNNIGGTPELVRDDGIVVKLDRDFPSTPTYILKDLSVVGSKIVDVQLLSQAILDALVRDWSIDRPDLSIGNAAASYLRFMKDVLARS